jgi:hypothetical protein
VANQTINADCFAESRLRFRAHVSLPNMLAIITAFRSRLLSKDWDYHVWLLQRTLDSMLSQTNRVFTVAIVCHERPRIPQADDPRVRFLPVDFPPPQRNNDDMCADKVLKLSIGAEWAVSNGCSYVMLTDADDLLNRQVSEFVRRHGGANGWYTPTEYIYAYGSRWIRKNSRGSTISGPGVIVRSDLLKSESPPFTGQWVNLIVEGGEKNYVRFLARRNRRVITIAATGLAYFQKLMSAEGTPLEPLPLTANVVINHSDSTSQITGGIGTAVPDKPTARTALAALRRIKRIGSTFPSIRPLTRALREEFAIPAPHEVPTAYRHRGSMFSRDISVESWLGKN